MLPPFSRDAKAPYFKKTVRAVAERVSVFIAPVNFSMDKKSKKRIEVLRKKIPELQQRLAGAKQQMDDPQEVKQYEQQIAAALQEIEKLKG